MIQLRRTFMVLLSFLVVSSSFSFFGLQEQASAQSSSMPWRAVYEDFEDISDLRVTQAQANSVALEQVQRPNPVMHGQYAAKLTYDFLGTSGTSAAYVRFKNAAGADGRPIEGNPTEIGFWMYGAGNNSWVRAQIGGKNASNTATAVTLDFTTTTTRLDGWKYLSAQIPATLVSDLTLNFIYYVETGTKTAATLYLDQVSFLYQSSAVKELDFHSIRDLGVGESITPKLSIAHKDDTQLTYLAPSQVQMISSDEQVVTVLENGTVTAVAQGNATLTAIYNGLTTTAHIEVVEEPIAADSIIIDGPLSLVPTESETLTIYANYPEHQIEDVTSRAVLSSSDPQIVNVTGNEITGVSYGAATITATYATYQKDVTAVHHIVVQPGELRSIAIVDTFSAIIGGPEVKANVVGTYRIEGERNITSGVTFSIDKPNIATIDANTGVITPLTVGVATITAQYNGMQAQTILVVTEASEPVKRELRGAWISTVENIDWPTRGDFDPASQREDFIKLLDDLEATGINAVFVQVRPTADSFFPSNKFPWSHWLTGEQGVAPSDNYDPLAFMIEEVQKRNMEFHAWINPFRIAMHTNINALADGHIARDNPDWTVAYDGKLFFNPGVAEARQYIIESIEEIVENYDVDGIHMDDYFYPYPSSTVFADASQYSEYQSGGGTLSLTDWRRDNVNQVVSGLYQTIKAEKDYVKFGISPFGIWKNASSDATGSATNGLESYSSIYADTRKWIQEGWVDYIAPQIYWHFGYRAAAYDVLVDWWMNEVETYANTHDVHLYIGHATYKAGTANWEAPDQIPAQLRYNQNKNGGVEGSILFSSNHFLSNPLGILDGIKSIYAKSALIPEMPWIQGATPAAIANEAAENVGSGIKLSWTDSDAEASYYGIYRTSGSNSIDTNDAAQLIAKVRKTSDATQSYIDENVVIGDTYNYVITAISRLHVESAPSIVLTKQAEQENPPVTPPDEENPPVVTPPDEENPPVVTPPDEENPPVTPPDEENPPVVTPPDEENPPVTPPVVNPPVVSPPVVTPEPEPTVPDDGQDNDQGEGSHISDFVDIDDSHWAYSYLATVISKNIFSGYPDGTLQPSQAMTRAEYVMALSRLNLISTSSNPVSFKDIKADAWYADAVLSFAAANIISGYEDGSFKPGQTLSREEAFVIIYRLFKSSLDSSTAQPVSFNDADKVSSWAMEAIQALASKGIIEGNPSNEINPSQKITRAEIAKIIVLLTQN